MTAPDFWDESGSAQPVIAEVKQLQALLESVDAVTRELEDAQVLLELAAEEQDLSIKEELEQAARKRTKDLDELELQSLLSLIQVLTDQWVLHSRICDQRMEMSAKLVQRR